MRAIRVRQSSRRLSSAIAFTKSSTPAGVGFVFCAAMVSSFGRVPGAQPDGPARRAIARSLSQRRPTPGSCISGTTSGIVVGRAMACPIVRVGRRTGQQHPAAIVRGIVEGFMLPETFRRERPLILALVLVGTILGGLLVGYEPVGGDPDRMYRPLKSELARALDEGRLPFWSDRFGLGVPLVAESHVAAFYPAEPGPLPRPRRPDRLPAVDVAALPGPRRRDVLLRAMPRHRALGRGDGRRWRSRSAGSRRSTRATSRSTA